MKRIILSFFLLAFIALNTAFSQAKLNLDSLVAYNDKYMKEDTVKVKMLIEIATKYIKGNTEKAIEYGEKSVVISEKLNIPFFVADAYFTLGNAFEAKGKYTEATEWLNKALPIFERLHTYIYVAKTYDRLGAVAIAKQDGREAEQYFEKAINIFEKNGAKKDLSFSINNLANAYMANSEYAKAISTFDKSIRLSETMKDKAAIAVALSNKAGSYYYLSEYIKSIDCLQKALTINEQMGDKRASLFNYVGLATIYNEMGEYKKAIDFAKNGLKVNEYIKSKRLEAAFYTQLGFSYLSLKDNQNAIINYEKSNTILKEVNNQFELAENLAKLSDIFVEELKYSKAYHTRLSALQYFEKVDNPTFISTVQYKIGNLLLDMPDTALINVSLQPKDRLSISFDYLDKALKLCVKTGNRQIESHVWEAMSKGFEKQDNHIKAYDAYKKYITIKDSISGDEVKKQITRKEIQYEYDKKETVLKYEQQLTTEQLEKQKLLTFQQAQTLTLKEQALALSNKEKDLAHLAFLKEQAEKQEKEQALLLAQKDKDLAGVQILNLAKEKALQFQEIARKNATIGFLGASMLAILLAAALFYLWLKKRQAQVEATRQAELQAAFTQQLFAETESERARIARDLHDGISHELLGLKRSSLTDNSEAAQKIDGVIETIRQISRNLHPVMLDSIGLRLSIETFCEQFAEAHNIFVNHDIDYSKNLDKNTELQVFRIVQEALTNAAKHAKAQAANVSISDYNNGVLLKIQDNGKGFEVEKALNSGKAFGLQSIIERARIINTKAEITSTPKGTIIELKIN
jgi:two-component system, NarL family, sensor kinase